MLADALEIFGLDDDTNGVADVDPIDNRDLRLDLDEFEDDILAELADRPA
jgi:hypothetical protein